MNAETCIICGAVIPEGRQVCPQCENNERPTNRTFCIDLFAADDAKVRAELLQTPAVQLAAVLEDYVIKCEFFGERTIYGACIFEALSEGYRPFSNLWRREQWLEWLNDRHPLNRDKVYKSRIYKTHAKKQVQK